MSPSTDSIFCPPETCSGLNYGSVNIPKSFETTSYFVLRIKVDTRLAVEGARSTTSNTLLVTREAPKRQRHGDGHVNTNLPGLNVAHEAFGRRAGACEDGCAVAVLVGVDQRDGFVGGCYVEAHEDRAEDFFLVACHIWRYVGYYGGSDLDVEK